MILGLKYKGFEPEKQIKNCFIELLNGSNFDVDKLDYVVRDTKLSGISNIGIDIERLIGALSIVELTEYSIGESLMDNERFVNKTIIQKIKNTRDGTRFHITGELDGSILIQQQTKVKVYPGSHIVSLKAVGDKSENAKVIIEGMPKFYNDSEIILDGEPQTPISEDEGAPIGIAGAVDKLHSFVMKSATIYSDEHSVLTFTVNCGSYSMEFKDKCRIEIDGAFQNNSPIALTGSEKEPVVIAGVLYGMTVLDDKLDDRVPASEVHTSFSIGFMKQAVNVISNVLDARDYLYRWIYAHHKVIYYANFLVPAVATSVLSATKPKSFPKWELKYENIDNLDDAYVWTAIRYFKNKNTRRSSRIQGLYEQLLKRTYHKSLYKSLAEYDNFFDSFTKNEKLRIFKEFQKNIAPDICVSRTAGKPSAGFIKQEYIKDIQDETGQKLNIKEMIWVDASYQLKKNDPTTTYLIFTNDDVTTLSKIDLLNNHLVDSNRDTYYYFYLYYSTHDNADINLEEIKQILVNHLKKVLQNDKNSYE